MEPSEPPAAAQSPASATGQKRARDYGEVLKGLTPERDNNEDASPLLKRTKVVHSDDEDAGPDDGEVVEAPGQSQLEEQPGKQQDGQPDASAVADAGAEPTSKTVTEDTPLQTLADDSAAYAPEANETQAEATPAPKPDQETALDQETAPESLNVGAEEDKPKADEVSGSTDQKADTPQTPSGLNKGVGLGLRTSFGKPTPKAKAKAGKPLSSALVSSPMAAANADRGQPARDSTDSRPTTADAGASATENNSTDPAGIITFPSMNKTWKIDPAKFEPINCQPDGPEPAPTTDPFWNGWVKNNLEQLITIFNAENQPEVESITKPSLRAKLTRNAMHALMNSQVGILQGDKRTRNKARLVAIRYVSQIKDEVVEDAARRMHEPEQATNGDKNEEQPAPQPVPQPAPLPTPQQDRVEDEHPSRRASASQEDGEEGEIMSDHADNPAPVQLSPEELEQRALYYPGTEEYSTFCTHCTSIRHQSADCPQLTCQFCSSRDHSSWGCPSKQRCSKCRQVGHTVDTCQEKLALAKEEMVPCAFCQCAHTEDECTEIWRSFNPSEVEIRKVKDIPSFCYICGAEGHYGPECGLARKGKQALSVPHIWSQASRSLYIDPASPNIAIAWAGTGLNQNRSQSDFHIRGHARKQTHIHYVSSDDSEDEFLHAPIQRQTPRGGIRINTTTSRTPQRQQGGFSKLRRPESQRRQSEREFSPPPPPPPEYQHRNNGSWQPPLPAGPPPVFPPNIRQGFSAPLTQAAPGTLPPRPSQPQNRNVSSNSSRGSQNGPRRGRNRSRRGK